MSKTAAKRTTYMAPARPILTNEERAAILRRTRGSISAKTAKQMLAFVEKGRKEWDGRVANLPWPKRARKK